MPKEKQKTQSSVKKSSANSVATLRRRSLAPADPSTFKTGRNEIDEVIKGHDLTIEQINALKTHIKNFSQDHRLRAAFTCRGSTCISSHMCPFLRIERSDLCPVGQKCPIDMVMAIELYKEMEKELTKAGEAMDVFTETYIQELVAIELYLARIHDKLSQLDEEGNNPLLGTRVSNVNNRTGDVYWENVEHPLIITRHNLLDRKDRILKALLLTPESRARYKADKAKSLAEQMREIQKLAAMNLAAMQEKGHIDLEEIKRKASITYGKTEKHNI